MEAIDYEEDDGQRGKEGRGRSLLPLHLPYGAFSTTLLPHTGASLLAFFPPFRKMRYALSLTRNRANSPLVLLYCRSTAMAVTLVTARLGAILGNVVFGYLVEVNCAIPILSVAALLIVGGLAGLLLPNTTRTELA